MTDTAKTISFVAVAAVLAGLVYATRPRVREISLISDQGQALTPALTDPSAATSLEVVSFDEAAAKTRAFKVAFDARRWTIPSHNNYPADATDKVAGAASAFIGLQKEQVVSDLKADHARFGLLSPDEEHPGAVPGSIGTRVTIQAGNDTPVNLIIGKAFGAAPGSPFEAAGNRKYVREAGKNRVYVTSLTTGFSTKFTDWVQTDLLKTTAEQMTTVAVDRYRVDEEKGTLLDRQVIELSRPAFDPQTPGAVRSWKMDAKPGGGPGPGEVVNEARIAEITSTLTGLRIVGVRPKPPNLAKLLGGSDSSVTINVTDQLNLQTRGFYLSPRGQLLANDGQVSIKCNDGVVYSLWLGEVVPEGEDAASGGRVGGEATPSAATPAKPESTPNAPKGESRYLMVTVTYDEKLLAEPRKPDALLNLPTPVAPTPEGANGTENADADPPEIATAKQAYAAALENWKASKEAGRKRADELSRRFADWYYVIDGQSVSKLRPARTDLITPAPKPAVDPTPGAVTPAVPEGGPAKDGSGGQ